METTITPIITPSSLVSPDTPYDITQVDMLDLELLLTDIKMNQNIIIQLLGNIQAVLIWIVILMVMVGLFKLLYKALFKKNDTFLT